MPATASVKYQRIQLDIPGIVNETTPQRSGYKFIDIFKQLKRKRTFVKNDAIQIMVVFYITVSGNY